MRCLSVRNDIAGTRSTDGAKQMPAIAWWLTAGMALVDAFAAAAQVGGIVQVALGVVVVRGHDLEYMQLGICVDVARRQQKQRMSHAHLNTYTSTRHRRQR